MQTTKYGESNYEDNKSCTITNPPYGSISVSSFEVEVVSLLQAMKHDVGVEIFLLRVRLLVLINTSPHFAFRFPGIVFVASFTVDSVNNTRLFSTG